MSKVAPIRIVLPMPISVNVAYAGNGKRRYKSLRYKQWLTECLFSRNKKYYVDDTERLWVVYHFYSKWFTNKGDILTKDLDNYKKVLNDYLPNICIGFDDKQIFKETSYKMNNNKDMFDKVIVSVFNINYE